MTKPIRSRETLKSKITSAVHWRVPDSITSLPLGPLCAVLSLYTGYDPPVRPEGPLSTKVDSGYPTHENRPTLFQVSLPYSRVSPVVKNLGSLLSRTSDVLLLSSTYTPSCLSVSSVVVSPGSRCPGVVDDGPSRTRKTVFPLVTYQLRSYSMSTHQRIRAHYLSTPINPLCPIPFPNHTSLLYVKFSINPRLWLS